MASDVSVAGLGISDGTEQPLVTTQADKKLPAVATETSNGTTDDHQPASNPQPGEKQDTTDKGLEDDSTQQHAPVTTHRLSQPSKSILKKAKPPGSVSRFNGVLQSSLASFKRDILGYSGSASGHTHPNALTQQPGPLLNETQLNTSNNSAAISPFWKLASLSKWESVLPSLPLPTQLPAALDPTQSSQKDHPSLDPSQLSVKSIRSVKFPLTGFRVVYPLQQTLPPAAESTTRDKIHQQHLAQLKQRTNAQFWNAAELVKLYCLSCHMREEQPHQSVLAALHADAPDAPKSIDLARTALSLGQAEALGDLLSVDFGCKKLVLEDSNLDDDSLKVLLHALLVSACISTLNIAANRKVKQKGWRNSAVFVRKAHFLKSLDLSGNVIEKRTLDMLSQALMPRQLATLVPGVLSDGPTNENLRNDDSMANEDTDNLPRRPFSVIAPAPLLSDNTDRTPTAAKISSLQSLRLENCSLKTHALEGLAHGIRHSSVKHLSLRRNKINEKGAFACAVMIRDYPVEADSPTLTSFAIASKPSMAFTSRDGEVLDDRFRANGKPLYDADEDDDEDNFSEMPRARARLRLRQEMDRLPIVGCLLTLDLRGNDIKIGAQHIAQVLKRNRTLKVLNLAANRIDVGGLVALADALRYNNTLETLDLSQNPCCGPRIDGVMALRSAFLYNTSLLRMFLAATDFSSEGAICLAEFLPELKSLIHLDLTENHSVDMAGVMALAVAVKMNTTLRCLDLNIPPNDPDFSRLSQDILQSCIRNTEFAQQESKAKGLKQSIAKPILKSTVARNLETLNRQSQDQARRARNAQSFEQITTAAVQSHDLLASLLNNTNEPSHEMLRDALSQARAAQLQLAETLPAIKDPSARSVTIQVNENLLESCLAVEHIITPPMTRPSIPSPLLLDAPQQLASPAFSITDSDESENDDAGPNEAEKRKNKVPKIKVNSQDLLIAGPIRGDDGAATQTSPPPSPVTQQSKRYVEEEGEVFRRKTILDSQADEDNAADARPELSGEEMRKELLETDVERTVRSSPQLPLETEQVNENGGD